MMLLQSNGPAAALLLFLSPFPLLNNKETFISATSSMGEVDGDGRQSHDVNAGRSRNNGMTGGSDGERSLLSGRYELVEKHHSVRLFDHVEDAENLRGFHKYNPGLPPPDPVGAVSRTRLVSTGNFFIEIRNRTASTSPGDDAEGGERLFLRDLHLFFESQGVQVVGGDDRIFDPKIVYDEYEDRFVVCVSWTVRNKWKYEVSNILLAASTDGSPSGQDDWRFRTIDALETNLFSGNIWADFPSVAFDEQAVYVTAEMFPHENWVWLTLGRIKNRLWIIEKTEFYSGEGDLKFTKHDPYDEANLAYTKSVTVPAMVYNGPIPGGGGTYLVTYVTDTLTPNDYLLVIMVHNPVTSPTFSWERVPLGNNDYNWIISPTEILPHAPQKNTDDEITVVDRRPLFAIWRDDKLWTAFTVKPLDRDESTAHWVSVNTPSNGVSTLTLADQGDIAGQDDSAGEFTTCYPSVAVGKKGRAAFGFSASSPSTFMGAYVTFRYPTDPPGSVRDWHVVQDGLAEYRRRVSNGVSRWGDYSSTTVDPADDDSFWVYNMYADTKGNKNDKGEDGRWGTVWARFRFHLPCEPNPCQNRGICKEKTVGGDEYKCSCRDGFTGKDCQHQKNSCKSAIGARCRKSGGIPCCMGFVCVQNKNVGKSFCRICRKKNQSCNQNSQKKKCCNGLVCVLKKKKGQMNKKICMERKPKTAAHVCLQRVSLSLGAKSRTTLAASINVCAASSNGIGRKRNFRECIKRLVARLIRQKTISKMQGHRIRRRCSKYKGPFG